MLKRTTAMHEINESNQYMSFFFLICICILIYIVRVLFFSHTLITYSLYMIYCFLVFLQVICAFSLNYLGFMFCHFFRPRQNILWWVNERVHTLFFIGPKPCNMIWICIVNIKKIVLAIEVEDNSLKSKQYKVKLTSE